MRRRLFAGCLVLFALWFVWKAVPFLDRARPNTYATPTMQPYDPGLLAPIALKGGKTACVDRIPYGPDARYLQFTLTGSTRPASPLTLVASGPGYRAETQTPAGAPGDELQTVPITPAARTIADGRLCFSNDGRHQVKLYGINPGRGSSPSTTVVDGQAIDPDLSITVLTSPSQSLGSRLGSLSSRIAAFRPLTGWEVWILGLLAVLGVPLAVAWALARAAAEDDAQDRGPDGEPDPAAADNRPQPSARR